jgi:hypothetical protein
MYDMNMIIDLAAEAGVTVGTPSELETAATIYENEVWTAAAAAQKGTPCPLHFGLHPYLWAVWTAVSSSLTSTVLDP